MSGQAKQKEGVMTEGVVAFSNLTEYDTYQGQSTGRYNIVIVLDDAEVSKLEDLGVKLREYKEKKQRKFASKFEVPVVDSDNHPVSGEVPYGSKVRILWKKGDTHPQHGTGTYLERVRVLEFADNLGGDSVPEEF